MLIYYILNSVQTEGKVLKIVFHLSISYDFFKIFFEIYLQHNYKFLALTL